MLNARRKADLCPGRILVIIGLSVTAFALGGCGQAVGGQGVGAGEATSGAPETVPATQMTGDGDAPTLDFKRPPPIADLVAVADVQEASKSLTFVPVVPSTPASPDEVDVSELVDTLALVYHGLPFGTFWLEEAVTSDGSPDEIDRLTACDPSVTPGCNPEWKLAVLADGTHAATISSPPSTVVIFFHGGLRFDIVGPPDTFSLTDALVVANAAVAASKGARGRSLHSRARDAERAPGLLGVPATLGQVT